MRRRWLLVSVVMAACSAEVPSLTFVDGAPSAAGLQHVHLPGAFESEQHARDTWGLPADVLVMEDTTIDALVDLAQQHPLHLTGYGAGASLAWQMACEHPDLVRTVVMLNGTANTDACATNGVVSTLVIAGTHDDVVPYSDAMIAYARAKDLAQCAVKEEAGTIVDLGVPSDRFACNVFTERGMVSAEHWRAIGWSHVPSLPIGWWLSLSEWVDLRD